MPRPVRMQEGALLGGPMPSIVYLRDEAPERSWGDSWDCFLVHDWGSWWGCAEAQGLPRAPVEGP
jgi:hypothetical protein